MTRFIQPSVILTALLSFALPAQAQNGSLTRSFVSSSGVDTNSCMITAPCQSFAEAYTKIGANGIVAALDPGKYGPITITGPVTINGNGWAAITAPGGGNGITINATASDNVQLIGLAIDGAGAGYNGIVFNSGRGLDVTNCTLTAFVEDPALDANTGNGILIQPTTGAVRFNISGTTLSGSRNAGIFYFPPSGSATANGIIDHVQADNTGDGIAVSTTAGGGSTGITISNSVASNNGFNGIYVDGPSSTRVAIDNVTIVGNATGIDAIGTPDLLLGRSIITNNTTGINNAMSANTFFTYKNNQINLNTTADVNGNFTLNNTFTFQ
jgi:hypothetical protein